MKQRKHWNKQTDRQTTIPPSPVYCCTAGKQ